MPAFDLAWTYVSEMDKSVAFYESLLNAEVQFTSPDWTSLRVDGLTIGLHSGAKSEPGLTNFTLAFTVSDILSTRQKAEVLGAKISDFHETPRGVLFSAEDPDGNTLQFMQSGLRLSELMA